MAKIVKTLTCLLVVKDFFRQTTSWNELYKIHGSISDPNSLIITENDYKKFEYDSIILNAKLLTSLVDSPIIFIGYSLSDKNIRSLLQEYSKNIPTNVSKMADRITVVEYEPNISSLEENIEHDQELGITYNRITTDNYLSLFENISKINQGVSPAFIKKYQKQFKNIIDVKGRSGELDTFLTYASNIDSLPEDYKNRNTAIAIGEQGTLFMVPNIVDYLNDYLLDKQKISLQISIKFLNNQTSGAQIPYKKIIDELNSSNDITLTTKDKLRIDKRIESTRTLECQINAIKINIKDKYFLSKSIHEIWNSKELKEINKIKLISKTIKNHPKDIENFILQEALPQFTELYNSGAKSNGVHSAYRKLFVMYDLYKNGNIDTTIK
ncbi:SIR2 family NAD-dependent protein deacylase [Fructobacillus fructosus]|uniref:SIR2 family NAD-dependent protein deacylase n=1 Tax=Fructobacillus fructosus TaxID=1631 RepID=UPI0002D9CBB1|nr:SIR2 family protein [Fructobacillus fructosus]